MAVTNSNAKKLTAECSNEYVPNAHETISLLVTDGQPNPAGQARHSAHPSGLYVPSIHNEANVGVWDTSGHE